MFFDRETNSDETRAKCVQEIGNKQNIFTVNVPFKQRYLKTCYTERWSAKNGMDLFLSENNNNVH